MNIRQMLEDNERKILSPFAQLSVNSIGRPIHMEEDDLRTCFQRDRDRIIHSKAFRRLKHKTQVFTCYEYNDHLRTRLTHTLEVSQVARTIARSLRLNEDLTEAISVGHDIGHCLFSHSGEMVLEELFGDFKHNEHSAKLATGMNLSNEVIDGILKHSSSRNTEDAITLEGKIVRYADKFAYLNADLDDGIRMGILSEKDIPKEIRKVLGNSAVDRLDTMIRDIISNSINQNHIKLSAEVEESFKALRKFMFDTLYYSKEVRERDQVVKKIIHAIYENEEKLGKTEEEILDFMAGMTDSFATKYFMDIHHINPFSLNIMQPKTK